MGCGSSSGQLAAQTQLRCRLTEKQIEIVQDTWPLIDRNLANAGMMAFLHLFTISPDLKPFFGIPIQKEVDMDDPILGAHAGAFMGTLGIAVESLKDSQRVAELVTDLGHRHVDRKVHVNDLRRLWPAVDMMLKEVLMYAYTLEVRDAWRAIFDFLVERMEIGMNLEYESGTLANANGTSVEGANGKLPSSHKDGPSTSGNMVENGKGK